MNEMQFEWDARKAAANERKHGVHFKEAETVFFDRLASMLFDEPNSTALEDRFVLSGLSESGRILVIAFCERGDRTRIISARPATAGERRRYEANR